MKSKLNRLALTRQIIPFSDQSYGILKITIAFYEKEYYDMVIKNRKR